MVRFPCHLSRHQHHVRARRKTQWNGEPFPFRRSYFPSSKHLLQAEVTFATAADAKAAMGKHRQNMGSRYIYLDSSSNVANRMPLVYCPITSCQPRLLLKSCVLVAYYYCLSRIKRSYVVYVDKFCPLAFNFS